MWIILKKKKEVINFKNYKVIIFIHVVTPHVITIKSDNSN